MYSRTVLELSSFFYAGNSFPFKSIGSRVRFPIQIWIGVAHSDLVTDLRKILSGRIQINITGTFVSGFCAQRTRAHIFLTCIKIKKEPTKKKIF